MRRVAIAVVIGSTMLAAAGVRAEAQTARMRFGDKPPTADLTPSQRAFTRDYVSAITGHDLGHRKRLVHPASLACQGKENEDFFQELYARHQGTATHQPPVAVESLPPTLSIFETFAKYGYRYPVRPTHAFYVDLVPTGPKQKSVVAFSILDGGSWYEVLPCPTPEGLVAYRARKAQAAVDDAAAQELARSLPDSVRTQITVLLREGGRVAAMKKYAELSGQSLAVAKRVVELVESARR